MPPRKSNVPAVVEEESPAPKSASKEPRDDALSVEDLNLPKSIVQRLAKGVLPPNTQIQKDALFAMSKSATVFVNYITSCAADHALRAGKKTVMPRDVFDAMTELEFPFMLPRLEAEVTKFTAIQADKRNLYRKKVREEKKAVGPAAAVPGQEGGDEGDEPAAKRARMDGEVAQSEEEEEGDEAVDVDGEDEEVEDDEMEEEEGEEGDKEEGLTEDLLEEREEKDEDEEMGDGEESD
ncbi:histone-fold-containing protein [Ampelomyces quisqualis]|uniref:DNA polymerase epsilon subunit D n=1 Tax=Ampelomyces quisqualis TaxID=50730 RepID=A0A6A5QHM3_AMPQU|nr:histone-fold-containing protein [Ampelomyces quisqualis]